MSAKLLNVQYTCPAMKHVLINFYRKSTRIFMNSDGFFELSSQEGTTQGCPLAMAMYALALVPLAKELLPLCRQIWYADDASGCDDFVRLRKWYDALCAKGPLYGYHPSPKKCILVVKPERLAAASFLSSQQQSHMLPSLPSLMLYSVNGHFCLAPCPA